jgi:hypothetical protein
MLRITILGGQTLETILLEGKIVGPWVEEFDRTWRAHAPSLGSKKLQLDLRGVDFVDAEGSKLLREIYRQTKASFLTSSPWTQHFADDAMRKISTNAEQGA